MTAPDTARRERANEYEGMTFYDLCCLVIQRDDEIAALRTSCDEWRARASNKTNDNMDLRSEIAALRDRVSRYERTQADWPIVEGEYKAEIAALREAALDLIDEINKHPISSTISSTSIHYFKRTLSDRCPARPKAKP